MPRKGENIYRRKDGRWEGRYIRSHHKNGKADYGYIYGKTYNEVKQKLPKMKAFSQQRSEKQREQTMTYDQLLDEWLRTTRLKTKESTYAHYAHLIQSHIRPHLGNWQVSQLTTQRIEGFITDQLKNGRLDHRGGLSPKTVTDMLTMIKSTMDYASYHNYDVSCNLKKLSIKKKEKEMRVLTQAEQHALIKILVTEMDLSKFGVLLSLYTGIRIGELCALKWENLCFPESVLKIKKTMQRIQETEMGATRKTKVIITEPKSKCSVREIPLPAFLADMARQFFTSPQAFVLTGDSKHFMEPRTMQNRFKTYVAESGIEEANFHALRHTLLLDTQTKIKKLETEFNHYKRDKEEQINDYSKQKENIKNPSEIMAVAILVIVGFLVVITIVEDGFWLGILALFIFGAIGSGIVTIVGDLMDIPSKRKCEEIDAKIRKLNSELADCTNKYNLEMKLLNEIIQKAR